jgi:hypothetical protein
MNTMSETTGDSPALEKDSVHSEKNDNFESKTSNSDDQLNTQSPLLPRSGWQNQQAFLRVLIKAKRSLDIAEIAATVWD